MSATLARVPNQPKTPVKCFRIPEDLYADVQAAAKANGDTVTDIVRAAFVAYLTRHPAPKEQS